MSYEPNKKNRVIAVVSGKGGSGKTMLAAMLARLFDNTGYHTLLIDADFGTGGLTYYMGLNEVCNISVGLTNLMARDDEPTPNDKSKVFRARELVTFSEMYHVTTDFREPFPANNLIQQVKSSKNLCFIGIGDHRRYLRLQQGKKYCPDFEPLIRFISDVRLTYDFVIIDCRGGIDEESLAVCSSADDILIVAETDTTSFQSTQHLVDVLYDNKLSEKLKGFFINKVFDDPRTIARNGTSSFRTQYLSAIPFDLDATRSFLIGDIPAIHSYFGRQLWHGAYKCFPLWLERPTLPSLRFTDFNGLAIRDKDSLLGGLLLSFLGLVVGTTLLFSMIEAPGREEGFALLLLLLLISSTAGIEPARRLLGRGITAYIELISKRLGLSSK